MPLNICHLSPLLSISACSKQNYAFAYSTFSKIPNKIDFPLTGSLLQWLPPRQTFADVRSIIHLRQSAGSTCVKYFKSSTFFLPYTWVPISLSVFLINQIFVAYFISFLVSFAFLAVATISTGTSYFHISPALSLGHCVITYLYIIMSSAGDSHVIAQSELGVPAVSTGGNGRRVFERSSGCNLYVLKWKCGILSIQFACWFLYS